MTEALVANYSEAEATLKIPTLKQALYDQGAVLLEKSVVNLHGDEHRYKRSVVMNVLRRDFFRHYQNYIFPRALKETLEPCIAAGGGNMVEFAYRVLVNLVADTAGVDRRFSQQDTDRLFTIIQMLGKAPTMGQLVGGDRQAMHDTIVQAMEDFKSEFYGPSVDRRRALLARAATGDTVELPNDVLTAMLKGYPDGKISEHDLMRDTAFFILAGAFTTANTLMHAIHEILRWCAKDPGRRPEIMRNPVLLQRCIWESIRLHPASPVAKRRATCPVHLPTGADVVEDDIVVVDMAKANRDPSIFGPTADEYDPNRPSPASARVSRFGLSFGSGAHACLGRMIAAGLEITDANVNAEETEFGTLYLIIHELLAQGIELDPDNPPSIDESTTRRHFHKLPFLLKRGS